MHWTEKLRNGNEFIGSSPRSNGQPSACQNDRYAFMPRSSGAIQPADSSATIAAKTVCLVIAA